MSIIEHPRSNHPSAYAMLTQKQLVNTIQVQLLTTKGHLLTINQDNNLLLPLLQDAVGGEGDSPERDGWMASPS